jgi:hypothetical protein
MWDLWPTKCHWGRVSSEYFRFPRLFAFHRLLHNHHLWYRGGTIRQIVAAVPSWLSLTPMRKIKKKSGHTASTSYSLSASRHIQSGHLQVLHSSYNIIHCRTQFPKQRLSTKCVFRALRTCFKTLFLESFEPLREGLFRSLGQTLHS